MNQQEIGGFIATKRKEKNLTQEQLSEKLGVSNKTVSKWENGKCMPDYSVVELLCKELGITISELLDGKEMESDGVEISSVEQMELLSYKIQQIENKQNASTRKTVKKGVTFGTILAMVISYTNWHSIGWAILHGLMSWAYVIYYLIKY